MRTTICFADNATAIDEVPEWKSAENCAFRLRDQHTIVTRIDLRSKPDLQQGFDLFLPGRDQRVTNEHCVLLHFRDISSHTESWLSGLSQALRDNYVDLQSVWPIALDFLRYSDTRWPRPTDQPRDEPTLSLRVKTPSGPDSHCKRIPVQSRQPVMMRCEPQGGKLIQQCEIRITPSASTQALCLRLALRPLPKRHGRLAGLPVIDRLWSQIIPWCNIESTVKLARISKLSRATVLSVHSAGTGIDLVHRCLERGVYFKECALEEFGTRRVLDTHSVDLESLDVFQSEESDFVFRLLNHFPLIVSLVGLSPKTLISGNSQSWQTGGSLLTWREPNKMQDDKDVTSPIVCLRTSQTLVDYSFDEEEDEMSSDEKEEETSPIHRMDEKETSLIHQMDEKLTSLIHQMDGKELSFEHRIYIYRADGLRSLNKIRVRMEPFNLGNTNNLPNDCLLDS